MRDAPPGYPAQWESDAIVSDGGTVHIRPIVPDDGKALESLHERLSRETIYYRFFSPLPRLSARMVERFTVVDYVDRLALVALIGSDIVAVARYDRLPETGPDGGGTAEVAFLVVDSEQGRGLGTLLLEHLAVAAAANGIVRFVADTLPGNERMLKVFREAGFGDDRRFADGVIRVSFPIAPTEASVAASHGREARASARSVRRLLAPRSVAVIGASTRPGSVGAAVLRHLLRGEFRGPVYPVHPTAAHVGGVRAYPSVVDVPDQVDLAVVVTPAAAVEAVVEECARKRVAAVVVMSSGFSDAGPDGAEAERRLVALARGNGMRLVGPNGLGVANTDPEVQLNATLAPRLPAPGAVGLVSQSGTLGIALLETCRELGIGVSSFVSAGNRADLSSNDMLEYWDGDDATQVVLMHIERFGNPRRFARVARRVARRKPVVVMAAGGVSGRSAQARRVEVLFRQAGVVQVATLEELFDLALALQSQPLPAGRRVAIVANTGGPGTIAADACGGAGLTVASLVELAPSAAAADYRAALESALAADDIDAVLAICLPPVGTLHEDVAAEVAAVVAAGPGKPVLANLFGARGMRYTETGPGLPCYPFPESPARTLTRMADISEWRTRPEGVVPTLDGIDPEAARLITSTAVADGADGEDQPVVLDPLTAGELLRSYGIPVIEHAVAGSADEAVEIAEGLGYPVAVRPLAPTISLGGPDERSVRLGLRSAEQVRAAWPGAGAAVVQPMAARGVHVMAAVEPDPVFGPVLVYGVGGGVAELLGERTARALPLTDADAASLVRSGRGAPLLEGWRGAPPADRDALEDLLLRVSQLVEDQPEVLALTLDPILVHPEGVTVAAATVTVSAPHPTPERALRRL